MQAFNIESIPGGGSSAVLARFRNVAGWKAVG